MPGRLPGVGGEVAGTPEGGSREPPPRKCRGDKTHAEEVFVYVCVCVRVEHCARRNGNYKQPLPMGTNSRVLTTGFVHNKNETSSHTHTRPQENTPRRP